MEEEKEYLKQAEESEHTETEQEDTKGDRAYIFLIGFLSGILVVLLFMGIFLMRFRAALEKRVAESSKQANEMEEMKETELQLDLETVLLKIHALEDTINTYSIYQTTNEKMEESIYDGIMASLDDPYSVYYTKEEMDDLDEATQGEYTGIGATLTQDAETKEIRVSNCFADSPAMEAGLLSQDVILQVNETEVAGKELAEVVTMIRKGDADLIRMKIRRADEELELEINRGMVEIPTVSTRMLEDGIGYMILSEFDVVTEAQFSQGLEELTEQGMERLIIDLRDNPGGLLQVVVAMLDEILPEGLIVYTEDKYGNREEYRSDAEHELDIPLVVLINQNSASASEIFAGAVKDYGLGKLVGNTTFGKGIVQNQFRLKDGTGMKMTVAKYYTPNGHDIHKKGVEPDVEIDLDLKDAQTYSYEVDNQLQKALEVVKAL